MSNFETWWEREGQEFLYALNTTTDDDIKLVAEVAWKNGAYCAKQAEQEPVAIADGTFNHNCPIGTPLYAAPVQQVTRADLKAAFKEGFERAADLYAPKAEQEPVAWVDLEQWQSGEYDCFTSEKVAEYMTPLYTAPVRTKDLTDQEIQKLRHKIDWTAEWSYVNFARAVIAADREKNRG